MTDKRNAKRFPIASVANVTTEGLDAPSKVQVRDISTEGMGCSGNHAYRKGDLMQVTLKLPTTAEGAREESLTGKIAWLEKFEEETETQYAFGIEFKNMEEQNPRLYEYLQYLGAYFL